MFIDTGYYLSILASCIYHAKVKQETVTVLSTPIFSFHFFPPFFFSPSVHLNTFTASIEINWLTLNYNVNGRHRKLYIQREYLF